MILCQRVIGRLRDGSDNQCGFAGRFRVSDPTDPWPLSYACDQCLPAVIGGLGGDVRVTAITAGEPLADPRPPEVAPFHSHNRVMGQPKSGDES